MDLQHGSTSKSTSTLKVPLFDKDAYSQNKLPANHKIAQDSFIMSMNRGYYAKMQEDGNFVVYKSNNFVPSNSVWSSGTHGKGTAPFHLIMQSDANLVIYDKNNKAIWASDTYKKGKFPCNLLIFDNGNMGIIDGEQNLIWEAKASIEKKKN